MTNLERFRWVRIALVGTALFIAGCLLWGVQR